MKTKAIESVEITKITGGGKTDIFMENGARTSGHRVANLEHWAADTKAYSLSVDKATGRETHKATLFYNI